MIWIRKFSPFLIKLEFITLFYCLISWQTDPNRFELLPFFVFLISFVNIGVFGYIINDLSDEKSDQLAGKINLSSTINQFQKIILILVTIILGVLPISMLSPSVLPLLILELILLCFYAFPPIRLKEKGVFGVLADSLYAYVVPIFIMLVFLNEDNSVDLFFWVFLPVFGFFVGIKNILNHQLEDFDNDIISGVNTFAIDQKELAQSQEVMVALAAVSCWYLGIGYVYLSDYIIGIKVCFFVVGIVYFFRTFTFFIYKDKKFLAEVPEFALIFYGFFFATVFMLIEKQYQYFFLVFFFLSPHLSLKLKYMLLFCRGLLSYLINYSLYFVALFFGHDLKERAKMKSLMYQVFIQSVDLQEKNVHGLWIGNQLSNMEILTIHSFIAQGYKFHLWTYEPLKNTLPKECVVCDANDIIPFERVFKYKYSSQFGTGKGSYAGFSDIFRYKLLYEKGGWWVDMDVTCLKPFDVDSPYFFRAHHDLPLVGNIMKAPQGSELMLKCYEEASREVDENNRDWHKPIAILVKNVFEFELQKFIVRDVSNTDEWYKIKPFVYSNKVAVPENWFFVHWCNEVWRTNGYDKGSPLYSSFYGQLLVKYKLIPILPRETWKKNDRKLKVRLTVERILDYI